MTNHQHPWSITPGEFDFIGDFIVKHNLRRGYECATAFGISGLAAAFGFRKTGGVLVTMDAYVEEKFNFCFGYKDLTSFDASDPDGLKSVQWLLNNFGMADVVRPKVGWSPDNVAQAIESEYGGEAKIDYAFIDAGHWDEAAILDVTSIRPFIDTTTPYAIFFHDLPCFTEKLWAVTRALYGVEMRPIGPLPGGTWEMGIISNLET